MNHTKEDQVKESKTAIPQSNVALNADEFADFMRNTLISATFITLRDLGLLKAETIDSPEFRDKFIKHFDEVVDSCANATLYLMGKEVK